MCSPASSWATMEWFLNYHLVWTQLGIVGTWKDPASLWTEYNYVVEKLANWSTPSPFSLTFSGIRVKKTVKAFVLMVKSNSYRKRLCTSGNTSCTHLIISLLMCHAWKTVYDTCITHASEKILMHIVFFCYLSTNFHDPSMKQVNGK